MFWDAIHWPTFIISFCIGIVALYITGKNVKTTTVYPTPANAGKVKYTDMAGNCYTYKSEQVKCPLPIFIHTIPISE